MIESILYKTSIYCRLSLDDGSLGESGSIQKQKMMLEKYCRDNNFTIKEVYIDDGYSGLNFDRLAFKRLIADIESGKINLVITKDLSRLDRDYLQTGYYTEQYFPLHNVRYIAVNDGVDTLIDNNDIAPFKNILNDMYAKDQGAEGWELFGWTMVGIVGGGIVGGALGAGAGALVTKATGILGFSIVKGNVFVVTKTMVIGHYGYAAL